MSGKEIDQKLYERTLGGLKRCRFPGGFNLKLGMCDPRPGEDILDIGCGIGWFAAAMASQYGANVLGIDASEYAVSEARKRYGNVRNLDFQACDALLIEYEKSFDKIVCRDVLEHFSYEDGQILIEEDSYSLERGRHSDFVRTGE